MSLESFLHRGDAPAPPRRIAIRRRLLGRGNRLRTLGSAVGLISLGLTLGQSAHAATKNWVGPAALTDWYANAAYWNPTGFPQPGDDARNTFIDRAMTLGSNASVNSFITNSAFTLNGGTFMGSTGVVGPDTPNLHTLQVNNIFTLNGGQVNNFTITAGVQQAGAPAPSVIVSGSNNNSLSNTIVGQNANLDMTQAGGGAFLRLFNTNTINGTLSLGSLNQNGSYGLRLNNGANLVIGSTGTFQGFGVTGEETSASTVTNNGLVNANSAGGNTLNLSQSVFNNNVGATAEATNGGILSLNKTINNSGMVKAVGTNSIVGITGTFTGTGSSATNLITASNGGSVQINGASLLGTINTDAATALVISGSNANSLSSTTVNGNLDMTQAGTGAFLRLYGTDTINGAISLGTVNQNGSYGLRLNNGATLLLNGGSSLVGFGVVNEETAASTVTNNGLVNANSAGGNTLNLSQSVFNNNVGATAEATNGGILSLNNTINNSGMVKAAGGTVAITGTFTGTGSSATNLITASGGGQVQINGVSLLGTINTDAATALVISGSNANSLSSTTVNGNLDMTQAGTGAFLRLYGTDTINGAISLGTVNQNGSYGLRLNNGANLVIGASVGNGSNLTGFGVVSEETNPSTLTNNNLVNANASGLTLNLSQSVFNNNGTAEATGGGILSLNNTTRNNAGATVAAIGKSGTNVGSIVAITGTFTGAGNNLLTASGGGQVQINTATLLGTINTAGTFLVLNGGDNRLNNTTVNGNLDMTQAGGGAFLRLLGTDTVNGTISLATVNQNGSYGLRLSNGATLNIGASVGNGSILQGFGNVSEETLPSTLTNNNLVNANSAGNTLTMGQSTFNNSAGATAEATNGGILSLNNATNNSGMVKAAGGTVVVAGTFTGTGTAAQGNLITASGGGQVQINGATLLGTINTDAATALMINGANNQLNNTTVNGNLNLADASQGDFLRLNGTDTVNGTITLGTLNQNGSYGLRLSNGATLNIGASVGNGSILQGFGNVSEETLPSTLTNNNLVNANSAGNTLTMGQSTFNNSAGATAEATNGGILSLNNATNNSGMVKAAGGTVAITGTFTGTGGSATNLITASNGGSVQINGASLLGTINTDAATALLISGSGANNLSGATVNGNLSLTDASQGDFLRLNGTDTVNGTITLGTLNNNGAYGLRLSNGANLILGSTGSLTGFGVVSEETAASTVTNNGTINANSAGKSLTFNETNFTNRSTGTAEATNGGTLTVTSPNATNSGTVTVLGGATANFTSGLTQTAGFTQVFGTLNANEAVQGGLFGGAGTVNGNVTNTGGTVQSVGNNAGGSLLISGNFTQTAGGTLDAFFGNSFHNLLTVTGQTTTGGTLGVFDLDFIPPAGVAAAGSKFAFLDYSGTLTPDGSLVNGFTQYFTNEVPDSNTSGKVVGANGFTFELTNDTVNKMLDLTVLTVGSPVPEASTPVSLGLLLALGLGGVVVASKRKKKA